MNLKPIFAFLLLLTTLLPADAAKPPLSDGVANAKRLSALYDDRESWEKRRDTLRTEVREQIRLDSALALCSGTEPTFTITRKEEYYTSANFFFETLPGYYVCGTVDFPKGKGRHPLIFCPNGHFRGGRYCREQQLMSGTLASMGAICVSYDLFGWGEGELYVGDKAHNTPVSQVMGALSTTLILDYMLTRDDVDPSRVGITGASGGGNHSILMSTVDSRFSAIAPVVGMSAHYPGGCGCEGGMKPTIAAGGTMTPEMLASSAPKDVLIVSDGGDWTCATPDVEYPFIRRIYGFYGAEKHVSNVHLPDEGHDMGPNKRNAVYAFFRKCFKLKRPDEAKAVVVDTSKLLAFGPDGQFKPKSKEVFISTGFIEPADKGLNFIFSEDGYHWKRVPGTWLAPEVGTEKVMRDPSIVQGPDGTFHLVWTSSWRRDYGIGYASSKDLVTWSEERHIELMRDYDPATYSVWAPELYYEETYGTYYIVWASAIPGRFEGAHKQFFSTTRDFKSFTPTELFYDPGYDVIDGAVLKRGEGDYVLAVKDNRRPDHSCIHVCFGPTPSGPWSGDSNPFTPEWSEGPTWAKVGDDYLIYFDLYRQFRYGAVKTRDFKTFTDITDEIEVPKAHKHGTIFTVDSSTFSNLLRASLVK